MSAIYSKK